MKATSGTIKLCDNLRKAEKQNYVVNTKDLLSLAMESIMLLGHANFSMNNMRRDRIKNSLQKDLHSLFEAGNPPTTLLSGDNPPKRKFAKQKNHQNVPQIYYLNHHGTQDIKTRKGAAKQIIFFCSKATNTEHDIAYNTKTTDNTGINKYGKYKALRHFVY